MGRPPTKGIIDPWRVSDTPAAPAAPTGNWEERRRQNLDEIDWERAIRVAGIFRFRSKHGTIEVKSRALDFQTGNDALRDLVRCLFEILEQDDGPQLFEDAGIGFRLHRREWLEPAADVKVARLATVEGYVPRSEIWFHKQPFDHGMLRLVRILVTVGRRPGPEGEAILAKWGVTPMTK